MLLHINKKFLFKFVINNRTKEKSSRKTAFFFGINCIRRDLKGRKENLPGEGFKPVELIIVFYRTSNSGREETWEKYKELRAAQKSTSENGG